MFVGVFFYMWPYFPVVLKLNEKTTTEDYEVQIQQGH